MKAAVLNSVPSALEIDDITIDTPQAHEVLIRTAAAGVCHSDLHFAEGTQLYPLPCVLGHESAGVVEAVGPDVTYVQPGDHVITCVSVFCGECEYCLTGRPSLCSSRARMRPKGAPPRLSRRGELLHQFFMTASFAEQLLVHEHGLVKITKDIPLDRAALIGCGVTTGVGAVFNTAKVQAGQTVAVIGCGGIGLNCIQGAAIAGAGRVIAVDMLPSKLKLAEQFGATDLVDASGGDAVAQVQELTGGGVHHAFEAIGLKVTAEQAFAMLKAGGTATVIGMIPVGTNVELPAEQLMSEKSIQGSRMGSNRFRIDMPVLVQLYLDGRLKLDELVSARIGLDQVNEAFETLKAGDIARSVIVFD